MKPFTLYDVLGVLAPGTVLVVGIVTLYPGTVGLFTRSDFTAGSFGLIVLVSYVAGNLVAALGNFLEVPYWWLARGRHTEKARSTKAGILSSFQLLQLQSKLHETGMLPPDRNLDQLAPEDWFGLTRQIHSYIDVRKLTERVELFNAQFGMNRGIAAGFLALAGMVFLHQGWSGWRIATLLGVAAVLAFYRMHRFSRHYAQALFRQFLVAPAQIPKASEKE
jgi:hypothetical protein